VPYRPERAYHPGGYAASDRGRSTCVALPPVRPTNVSRARADHQDPKEP
jgi:hypothetical protein